MNSEIHSTNIEYVKLPTRSPQDNGYNCGLYMCNQVKYLVEHIDGKEKFITLPAKGEEAYNFFKKNLYEAVCRDKMEMLYMRKCIILLVKRLLILFKNTTVSNQNVKSMKKEMTKRIFYAIRCIDLYLTSFLSSGEYFFCVSKSIQYKDTDMMAEEDYEILNGMGDQAANAFCETVGCTPYVNIGGMQPRQTNYTKSNKDQNKELPTKKSDIQPRLPKLNKKKKKKNQAKKKNF